nr:hypothetical protein [Tanacetum cinerariifolium]
KRKPTFQLPTTTLAGAVAASLGAAPVVVSADGGGGCGGGDGGDSDGGGCGNGCGGGCGGLTVLFCLDKIGKEKQTNVPTTRPPFTNDGAMVILAGTSASVSVAVSASGGGGCGDGGGDGSCGGGCGGGGCGGD